MTSELGVPADTESVSETQTMAIACLVAPERLEDAVAALPPERLLPALWWAGEMVSRANALKKALVIEASVALAHGEIQPELRLADRRFVFRADSKNEFDDIVDLGLDLHQCGVPWSAILRAVGYLKVTELQRAIAELVDDERRADAYATLEAHRVKKPTGFALIDLDQRASYRKTK